MLAKMGDVIREHGLNSLSMADAMARSMGVSRREESGENFRVANNDCVLEAAQMQGKLGRSDRDQYSVCEPLRIHAELQRLRTHGR